MDEYDPENPRMVVALLTDELEEQGLNGETIDMEYHTNGTFEWVTWMGYNLWDDNDNGCEAFEDEHGEEQLETVEACIRRRFDELLQRIGHMRLTPPKNPTVLNQPMSNHTGEDYTVLMLGDQDTDNFTARIYGNDLGETALIAAHITRLWNAARPVGVGEGTEFQALLQQPLEVHVDPNIVALMLPGETTETASARLFGGHAAPFAYRLAGLWNQARP